MTTPSRRRWSAGACLRLLAAFVTVSLVTAAAGWAQTRTTIAIRGHDQILYLYGPDTGDPVVVSSGDGGWMHLGPHVAEVLARRGMFVVGFDVKAYLSSFTSGHTALRTEDEPGDYKVLAQFARQRSGKRPILIGVSEGAGLSVLAATDPGTKTEIAGVIGLGLPDINELAWRWKDSLIYLTHKAPNEPTFSAGEIIDRVAPTPLAIIHSTHDEFVPLPDVQRMFTESREPKRMWIVDASNHRFSDSLDEFDRRLIEAITWVRDHMTR
jgi:hypothetical protein